MVAGAAPPAAMIEGMAKIGFDITHVYGLTEVYGPAAVAVKRDGWAGESAVGADAPERPPGRALRAAGRHDGDATPTTMAEVPADGADDGRDHVPRQHRDEGLPEEPDGDRRGVRRRLVPHRRPGGDRARPLRQDQGPQQGHHHLRRREHQLARGRGRAVPPSGGAGLRGGRAARPEVGRDAARLRRAEGRRRASTPPSWSRTARRCSPATRCRARSASRRSRRPRPARSRSSSCASARSSASAIE